MVLVENWTTNKRSRLFFGLTNTYKRTKVSWCWMNIWRNLLWNRKWWERGGVLRRKEKLPPEDSVLIRPLLHLLIVSHWDCKEISVACHYACRSDFSFTQLAYCCTIRPVCVCACASLRACWRVCVCVLKAPHHGFFCLFSLSYTLQWKAVKVIGKVRMVYKLVKMSCYWLSHMSISVFICVCSHVGYL